jgi:hypothetical protein
MLQKWHAANAHPTDIMTFKRGGLSGEGALAFFIDEITQAFAT